MRWYLFLLFSIFHFPLLGQYGFYASYHQPNEVVEVRLAESSYVVINGTTNVNQFHCNYDQLSTKPLAVNVLREADSVTIENAALILQTDQFDCENKMMNKDFQQLLQSEEYPHIEIQVLSLSKPPKSDKKLASHLNDERFTIWVQALFRIVGNEHQYSFPVKVINHSASSLNLQGSIDLNLLDFEITPPKKLLGLVEVDPWVTIDFVTTLEVIQP